MGAAIAGCSLLKGFGEEAEMAKDAQWEPEEKTTDLSELSMVPADTKTTADVSTNGTYDGSREICCGNHTPA